MQKTLKYILILILTSSLSSCFVSRPLTPEQKARIEAEVDAMWAANHPLDVKQTKEEKEAERLDKALIQEIKSWLGAPYRLGGNTRAGVDCSGLVCQVYQQVYGKQLHRKSDDQYRYDIAQYLNGNQLKTGDLVFFSINRRKGDVNHVGIYIGEYKFAHAGNHGVNIEDLRKAYWVRYWTAGGKVK